MSAIAIANSVRSSLKPHCHADLGTDSQMLEYPNVNQYLLGFCGLDRGAYSPNRKTPLCIKGKVRSM